MEETVENTSETKPEKPEETKELTDSSTVSEDLTQNEPEWSEKELDEVDSASYQKMSAKEQKQFGI